VGAIAEVPKDVDQVRRQRQSDGRECNADRHREPDAVDALGERGSEVAGPVGPRWLRFCRLGRGRARPALSITAETTLRPAGSAVRGAEVPDYCAISEQEQGLSLARARGAPTARALGRSEDTMRGCRLLTHLAMARGDASSKGLVLGSGFARPLSICTPVCTDERFSMESSSRPGWSYALRPDRALGLGLGIIRRAAPAAARSKVQRFGKAFPRVLKACNWLIATIAHASASTVADSSRIPPRRPVPRRVACPRDRRSGGSGVVGLSPPRSSSTGPRWPGSPT
jgi:hypothetical protein